MFFRFLVFQRLQESAWQDIHRNTANAGPGVRNAHRGGTAAAESLGRAFVVGPRRLSPRYAHPRGTAAAESPECAPRRDRCGCVQVMVYPWTDEYRQTYLPLRLGYAVTLLRVQGATLPHMTIYLDVANVEAAGYVALSRVRKDAHWRFVGDPGPHHSASPRAGLEVPPPYGRPEDSSGRSENVRNRDFRALPRWPRPARRGSRRVPRIPKVVFSIIPETF